MFKRAFAEYQSIYRWASQLSESDRLRVFRFVFGHAEDSAYLKSPPGARRGVRFVERAEFVDGARRIWTVSRRPVR